MGKNHVDQLTEVEKIMGSQLDHIVFKPTGPFNNPSTIIDLSSGKTVRP